MARAAAATLSALVVTAGVLGALAGPPQCMDPAPRTRYLLYTVNGGEGFNLARDVFVRVSALWRHLAATRPHERWVVVLPPFTNPHWRDGQDKAWGDFFDVEALGAETAVIELEDFLLRHAIAGADGRWRRRTSVLDAAVPSGDSSIGALESLVDHVLHLQFWMPPDGAWEPRVAPTDCDFGTYPGGKFWQDPVTGEWHGRMFGLGDRITARRLTCYDAFGDATVLADTLVALEGDVILVARFERLLHVDFGSAAYWSTRRSMIFAEVRSRRCVQAFGRICR